MHVFLNVSLHAIGFSIYHCGANAVREQTSSSLADQDAFTSFHLQSEIERIRLVQYRLTNNEYSNELVALRGQMSKYELLTSVNKLRTPVEQGIRRRLADRLR